jgi:hypothetical protein
MRKKGWGALSQRGARARGKTPELGKAKVVTNERADLCRATARILHVHDQHVGACLERRLLAGKEKVLAVGSANNAVGSDHDGAVGPASIGPPLRETSLQPDAPGPSDGREPTHGITRAGECIGVGRPRCLAHLRKHHVVARRESGCVDRTLDPPSVLGNVMPDRVRLHRKKAHATERTSFFPTNWI